MSQAFDVLSSAVDEAIENSKAEKKFLREETLSIEIESLNESIHRAVENSKSQNRPMEDAVEAICITLGLSEEVARKEVSAVWYGGADDDGHKRHEGT